MFYKACKGVFIISAFWTVYFIHSFDLSNFSFSGLCYFNNGTEIPCGLFVTQSFWLRMLKGTWNTFRFVTKETCHYSCIKNTKWAHPSWISSLFLTPWIYFRIPQMSFQPKVLWETFLTSPLVKLSHIMSYHHHIMHHKRNIRDE